MKGYVEVYSDYGTPNQKLIEASNNLIVDAGGEMIVDLMTLPVEGSAIPSASSIYDASNYTIRAISFGKAAQSYGNNTHGVTGIIKTGPQSNELRGISSTSSYTPTQYLPSEPSPYDTKLEIVPSSILNIGSGTYDGFGDASSAILSLSEYGQLVNIRNYYGQVYNAGHLPRWYIRAGCWPRATGDTLAIYNSASTLILSNTVSSTFNQVSSMDWRGFVNATSSTNSLSGLVTSSTSTFSSLGEVIYKITIASGDAATANMYGGITQMGLWRLDVKNMLSNGRNPPYSFHPYTNVLNYKLFSKKTFNKNLVGIQDSGANAGLLNYSNLTIIWRIFFI